MLECKSQFLCGCLVGAWAYFWLCIIAFAPLQASIWPLLSFTAVFVKPLHLFPLQRKKWSAWWKGCHENSEFHGDEHDHHRMYATLKLPLNFWTFYKRNACNQTHRPVFILLPPPFPPTLGLNLLHSAGLLANLNVTGQWIRPLKSNTPKLCKRVELDLSWGTVLLTINYLSSKVISSFWLLKFLGFFEFVTFYLQ